MLVWLLLVTGLLATAAARSPTQPQYPRGPGCTPGKSTFDGCNTCTCLPSYVISCTEKTCLPPPTSCQHGRSFIDQCQNKCICQPSGLYTCRARGTPGGGVCYGQTRAGEPISCEVDGEIRVEGHMRIFCQGGIVHYENTNSPDRCTPGTSWQEECNTCRCMTDGVHRSCTRKRCRTPQSSGPVLGENPQGKGRAGFGDKIVFSPERCPAALREGATTQLTTHCLAEGCTPGATWVLNRDCERCVCTQEGEAACTLCQEPSRSTPTCNGQSSCPADCGRKYIPERGCYECPCGVGREGDVHVAFDQPCPPGTGFRASGAFFMACGPLETLPQGDTQLCDTQECPADCGTVRVSPEENCVYCQCGPELDPGDVEVPIDEQCSPPLFPGPTQLTTRVCKAPTKLQCLPGTEYNLKCDHCICQADGTAACTRRDCSLPKYGDVQVCDREHRQCPADCGEVGQDSRCTYCQCGPRLRDGDVVVGADEPCPPGTSVSARQFATKTCSPGGTDPTGELGGCQYGPSFIDECGNACRCMGGKYACSYRGCPPGKTGGRPQSCDHSTELPRRGPLRVFCHDGIVKTQSRDKPCVPNSWSMDEEHCNTCTCNQNGAEACTLMACVEIPRRSRTGY